MFFIVSTVGACKLCCGLPVRRLEREGVSPAPPLEERRPTPPLLPVDTEDSCEVSKKPRGGGGRTAVSRGGGTADKAEKD